MPWSPHLKQLAEGRDQRHITYDTVGWKELIRYTLFSAAAMVDELAGPRRTAHQIGTQTRKRRELRA